MRKLSIGLYSILFATFAFASAPGQTDKLTYVLTHAVPNVDQQPARAGEPGGCNRANTDPVNIPCHSLEILFGKSFPQEKLAGSPRSWLVIVIDAHGNSVSFNPAAATPDKLNKEVILDLGTNMRREYYNLNAGGNIDRDTHKILVRYQEQNLPTVELDQPPKTAAQKAFTAAKGKSDADIYFSGSAAAARQSGPAYSIDAKAGYLWDLGHGGSLGVRGTFVSNSKSDVDPDSITVNGSYQKVVVNGETGLIVNSDFIGVELDKKAKTRNLMSEVDAVLVLPSLALSDSTFATADFMVGFEGGHNYRTEALPNGLGNLWRPKVGANAYLLVLHPRFFNRITLNGQYVLRLPQTDEPFTEKINGTKVTTLTTRPRHYVGVDLGLLFAPSYGFTIKYRYGSLPPDYKLVDSEISAGFALLLKQANK